MGLIRSSISDIGATKIVEDTSVEDPLEQLCRDIQKACDMTFSMDAEAKWKGSLVAGMMALQSVAFTYTGRLLQKKGYSYSTVAALASSVMLAGQGIFQCFQALSENSATNSLKKAVEDEWPFSPTEVCFGQLTKECVRQLSL